jgi:hypothetical protein
MELVTWTAAHRWIKCSRSRSKVDLPTPQQYGIGIKAACSPGITSLFSIIPYLFSKNRSHLPPMLRLLLFALFAQVVLGLAVAASDIWLHLASTMVPNAQVFPLGMVSTSYGRILPANCTTGEFEYVSENDVSIYNPPCSITTGENMTTFINGLAEGLSTVNNMSTTNSVHVDVNGTALIIEAQPAHNLEFTAYTLGMKSTCVPISAACYLG